MNSREIVEPKKLMPDMKCFSASFRPLQAVMALACIVVPQLECRAGGLMDVYNSIMTTDPASQVVDFHNKAAEQNVITQKRGYLPKLEVTAREAWAYQNIRESGNPVFPAGKGDFERRRAGVELDQPLFDPTVKPSIEASKARLRQVQSRGALNTEFQTREIVQEYLRLARYQELIGSVDRVIARLESESAAIAKSNDAKIATVGDVQGIKLSLAAMKRERSNFAQYQNRSLALLGVGPEVLRSASMSSDSLKDHSSPATPEAAAGEQKADLLVLRAEMDEYASQASVEKRRSLPTLSLYGQYGLYQDGGSIFGSALDQDLYEVGVVLKWDIFDRGINNSKAKEYEYLKRAKEAELLVRQRDSERASKAARDILAQSKRSVAELADLVEQNKVLMVSAARAYDAGKETYINSINAYLASEAATREWINARHDLVMTQVAARAETGGWNKSLVEKVDTLFASSK